eukprot:jgi/Psemu1/18089/gm1.18089_g
MANAFRSPTPALSSSSFRRPESSPPFLRASSSSSSSTLLDDSNSNAKAKANSNAKDNTGGGLSDELELLQRSLYRKEFESTKHESTWLDALRQQQPPPQQHRQSQEQERQQQQQQELQQERQDLLPFDCTGCGNCCKTTGNVYMSPEEVEAAASHLHQTVPDFIDAYAAYKLESPTSASASASTPTRTPTPTPTRTTRSVSAGDGDVPWILLRNSDAPAPVTVTAEEGESAPAPPACVFLDRETNRCGIYEVRPVQCSTYPFWSNMLESERHWNDEVRRVGGERGDDRNDDDDLPAWTPDGGGCEGMARIGDASSSSSSNSSSGESPGVPVTEALEQLSLYQRADRRLPRNYNKVPLRNNRKHKHKHNHNE